MTEEAQKVAEVLRDLLDQFEPTTPAEYVGEDEDGNDLVVTVTEETQDILTEAEEALYQFEQELDNGSGMHVIERVDQ